MLTRMDQLIVPARFNGPPRSANGGYVSGLLAHELVGEGAGALPVEVTLRRPPPLDTVLEVRRDPDEAHLWADDVELATARRVLDDLDAVAPVDVDTARAASDHYPGLTSHPFPTCFACGTARPDGLGIFPGEVEPGDHGGTRVAAVWTPPDQVQADWHAYDDPTERCSVAATWAALDCIGGWAGDLAERLMVLGRMTASLDALPAVGEPHVVMGQSHGSEGRRTHTSSTLYDPDGRIVARARHTWVAVDPTTFDR